MHFSYISNESHQSFKVECDHFDDDDDDDELEGRKEIKFVHLAGTE